MASHPWLSPQPSLVVDVGRKHASNLLRRLARVNAEKLGTRAGAWPPLLAAIPAMLDADREYLLDAFRRGDVLPVLQQLTSGPVDALRLERALLVLWLRLAGHPGLTAPLALPGPFRVHVVDPRAPRLLNFAGVRGLVATARGPVALGGKGRLVIETLVAEHLPDAGGAVVVDDQGHRPDEAVVARVQAVLDTAQSAFPLGGLERITIGRGDAALGEARVDENVEAVDLVASAQAGFIRAAAALEPPFNPGGTLVEQGRRLTPVDILARACGNAVALPLRADRSVTAKAIAEDLVELRLVADPTPRGAELMEALDTIAGGTSATSRRALLVNVDADDFVYSFQFGRSVERRCVERDLRVDRLSLNFARGRDLAAELGQTVPSPVAGGTETLADSVQDEATLMPALRRLSAQRYEVVVANVRPGMFYELLRAGFFASPTLLWDRHLHGGLREEGDRRGVDPATLGSFPIRVWSLDKKTGPGIQRSLADAGLVHGSGQIWPLDLEFFRSAVAADSGRVFAGGENQRDWPVFFEAVRDLPLDVHVVARGLPAALPPRVRVEPRLPLARFRDAMASAPIAAVPLLAGAAAGVTVIPMAMALGVAIVATRTPWTEPLVKDGEEGLLVPPDDVEAFRAALLRLHEQADLRNRLVANARAKVASLCDLEAFTRAMFATLDSR